MREATTMDPIARSLLEAQDKAAALFDAVLAADLIRPGRLESELSSDIHALAKSQFGLHRHWHKRIVRAGANTLLTYHQESVDRRIGGDDIVYLDLGTRPPRPAAADRRIPRRVVDYLKNPAAAFGPARHRGSRAAPICPSRVMRRKISAPARHPASKAPPQATIRTEIR